MSETINVMFIGDVVGTGGLALVSKMLRSLIAQHDIDFAIVNGENVADGKSLTKKQAAEIFEAGANIITTGNHVWDRWDSRGLLAEDRRILRPLNYPRENAGAGYAIAQTAKGTKVGVINLQGRTYMQTIDCPFHASNWVVEKVANETNVIIVDFHAEATAEKQSMGRYLDGQVSAVLGTHTHVQTADEQILPHGTAYLTDVGMTGPYDSVVGMRTDIAIKRFVYQTPFKYEIATNEVRIAGVRMTIDVETGCALSIDRFMFPEFTKTKTVAEVEAIATVEAATNKDKKPPTPAQAAEQLAPADQAN
jgi:metallophosphoesterase (TIGR00282 family)